MGGRGPGERAGLSRAAVLDAARALLAESGLSGVTMRALARRLEVAPNALYSWFPGKTELIDALLDDQLAAVVDPAVVDPAVVDPSVVDPSVVDPSVVDPSVADPLAAVAEVMTSTYDVLVARPDLVPLYLARQGARGESAVRLGTIMDDALARAGVDAADVPSARRTLIVHAIGSAAFATGADADRPVSRDDADATFRAGLRWLLAGIGAGGTVTDAPEPPGRSGS